MNSPSVAATPNRSSRLTSLGRRLWPVPEWIVLVAAVVVLALIAYQALAGAVAAVSPFDGYQANGIFQLYNPLRRIADGQAPGRDFVVFHGVGLPLLHYPLFALLGGDVVAASLSLSLTGFALTIVVIALVAWAWTRSISRAVVATAAIMAILEVAFPDIVQPGTSNLGTRSILPLLAVVPPLLWPNAPDRLRRWSPPVPWLAAAAICGVAFVCGTEHGLAATVTLALVALWRARVAGRSWWTSVVQAALAVAVAALVVVALVTIISRGHPGVTLTYALRDIPGDQSWFFGGPPNSFLTWPVIIEQVSRLTTWIVFGPLVVLAALWRRLGLSLRSAEGFATVFLVGTGVVVLLASMTGYFELALQAQPLARNSVIALTIALVVATTPIRGGARTAHARRWRLRPVATAGLALVLVVSAAGGVVAIRAQGPAQAAHNLRAALGQPTDLAASGPSIQGDLSQVFEVTQESTSYWSAYAGMPEATLGFFQPTTPGMDYIIHAVGPELRATYLEELQAAEPEFVSTMNRQYLRFEDWLRSTWGELYEYLLINYDIVLDDGTHVVWQRLDQPRDATELAALQPASGGGATYALPATSSDAIYRVDVEYDAGCSVPFTSKLERFILSADGSKLAYPVSIEPGSSTWHLLVPVTAGSSPTISLSAQGIVPFCSATITGVTAGLVDAGAANLASY